MSLTKEIRDKKVNFEFNKEFINVFSKKIRENDTNFLNRTLRELHPADSADLIENLIYENRHKLIELEGFSLDPEIFIELNESVQTEIFIILSIESIANILKRLESDNALKILENLDEKKKNIVLDKLPPKDRFLLQEGLSFPEDSAARTGCLVRSSAIDSRTDHRAETGDYARGHRCRRQERSSLDSVQPDPCVLDRQQRGPAVWPDPEGTQAPTAV